MGIIRLHNMTFFAHHGCLDAERELGQTFEVDIELRLDLRPAASSDDLSQAVDYSELYDVVEKVVTTSRFRLLEALADAIIRAIADRYRPRGVTVRVRKPRPPIRGQLDFAEVELSVD
jgi:dihydroneopterin aldolase